MPDTVPETPEHEVDPTLQRRLAWGLLAGFGLDEIARREGVARVDLEQVLASPGMIVLLWVWKTFFREHDRGGLAGLARIAEWALAFIRRHARERAVGPGVGYAFVCVFALRAALKPTLRALGRQIEAVIGHGPERRLSGVRAKLVEILCWAIETALTQQAVDQLGIDYLDALDEELRDAVASGRFGNSLAEYESGAVVVATGDEPDAARSRAKRKLGYLSLVVRTRAVRWRAMVDGHWRDGRCRLPPSVRLRPIGMAA